MRVWRWMKYNDIDQQIYGVITVLAFIAALTALVMFLDWLTHGAVLEAFFGLPREH